MYINMSNINNEIVCEGWLTKSPPSKRIWKARWRRRWFVLKHSGELPGQFFLLYYTDRNCRKLKGTIDLDQCEQVDAGLRFENSKQNYPFMFDVKTPKRTYYLAAESEVDMNKWVDCVCQVCGLKATIDDTSVEFIEENTDSVHCISETADTDSPPTSPTSSVSGPYIPISECHSGKPLNTPKGISDFNNIISRQELTNLKLNGKDYNAANAAHNQSYKANITKTNNIKQTICADDISKSDVSKPVALPVPVTTKPPVDRLNSLYGDRNVLKPRREDKITNIESAKKMAEMRDEFYDSPRKIVPDDDWPRPVPPAKAPVPNWDTFPTHEDGDFSPGDIGSWSVVERFGKLTVVDSKLPIVTNSLNRIHKQQRRQPDTYSLRRPVAPPRPPKPPHLVIPEQLRAEENEREQQQTQSEEEKIPITPTPTPVVVSDETYDVPRSHQVHNEVESPSATVPSRHIYSNAAPTQVQGNVFRYDFTDNPPLTAGRIGEPVSPRSECSSTQYSNLPSPLVNTPGIPTPPVVNRELKPTRKMSDSGASSEPSPGPFTPALGSYSAEPSPIGFGPPTIDRTLKPRKLHVEGAIKLARPPDGNLGMRRVRAGPSPTPPHGGSMPGKRNSRGRSEFGGDDGRRSPGDEQMYLFDSKNAMYAQMSMPQIQYLDLDLESDNIPGASGQGSTPPGGSCPSATPYKTIDFLKTEAFNRTREEQEEKRKEKEFPD